MNKYQRQIKKGVFFEVTCPATQHAIKKLLAPGQRGVKDKLTDLNEAKQSIDRAIQLEEDKFKDEVQE